MRMRILKTPNPSRFPSFLSVNFSKNARKEEIKAKNTHQMLWLFLLGFMKVTVAGKRLCLCQQRLVLKKTARWKWNNERRSEKSKWKWRGSLRKVTERNLKWKKALLLIPNPVPPLPPSPERFAAAAEGEAKMGIVRSSEWSVRECEK